MVEELKLKDEGEVLVIAAEGALQKKLYQTQIGRASCRERV